MTTWLPERTPWVWNWALAARRKVWARRREPLTSVGLSRMLTRYPSARRREAGSPKRRPAVLGQKLRDLDAAYRNAFSGCARLPRFKSRRGVQRARIAFDQRHAGKGRAWLDGRMVLPGLGAVKLRGRALPAAMLKLVTVSRDPVGRYWASFAVEEAIALVPPAPRPSVGLDLGVAHLVTLSTDKGVENPRHLSVRAHPSRSSNLSPLSSLFTSTALH